MNKNDGGAAFPTLTVVGDVGMSEGGMTLRDYFAANAPVTGIDANQSLLQQPDAARFASCDHDGAMPMPLIMKELVRLRWEYADAMLAVREKDPQP